MAGAVVEQAWRDAAPDDIEAALAALWREVAQEATVARAVMSNLVVVRACEADEPLDAFAGAHADAIDAVAGRHPSRVIVIAHEHACPLSRAPIAARVGVATYGPPQARYAIEQVCVRSSCESSSLPSIVRRLTRGDLPTSVWYLGDLSQQPPLEAIVAEARQLIYDSRLWRDVRAGVRGVMAAIDETRTDVADLNWRRLAPVRQALRHAGEALGVEDLSRARLTIAHAPDETALAWLLHGWLASRLGWSDDLRPRLIAQEGDAALTLTLGAPPAETTIALTPDHVRVAQHGWPPYVLGVPHEAAADAIAAELRSLSTDAVLLDTLRALARLTSAASS
ncbi:MAG TPA: glucose-6-phosphate dehydrogenase assembly protein OpcA [Vicinamibacterales bacterium]|nr:glucose-6-phosphate dehydrogenase assembly protein OpcA [Vicinamibacterales bacterium]